MYKLTFASDSNASVVRIIQATSNSLVMLSASPLLYLLFIIIRGTCGLGTVSDPGDRNENVVREIYWMDWMG